MRFTPAPGYYLYRDRSSFRLEAEGIQAGAPRWPRGVAHNDGYFGNVVVYFDQVDVPLPLLRSHARAGEATLTATFQGCQDEGICYPPMTRSVQLSLPAGTVAGADTGIGPGPETGARGADIDITAPPAATDGEDVAGGPGRLAVGGAGASAGGSAAAGAAADADADADAVNGSRNGNAVADNAIRSTPPVA